MVKITTINSTTDYGPSTMDLKIMNHEPNRKTLIVIVGPTAIGKTAIAIELAKLYNTVIVSADSRQFYREMSIGTAKPTNAELGTVKHYFINSHAITETFNVGDYEKESVKLLDELFQTHEKVILVGGSGLFIKAVCEGFDEFPDIEPAIRETLNVELSERGISALQERLKVADPEYYEQVDLNNPQRIIRALEVFEATGKPFSSYWKSNVNTRPFNIIKLGLNMERQALYKRINERVDVMISDGLIEEVKSLIPYKYLNTLNTVGYSEFFDYLDGITNLEEAIRLIKQNTRRFAKRQLTWFGKDKSIIWFTADKKGLSTEIKAAIDGNLSQ